jgi:hypothetical protein
MRPTVAFAGDAAARFVEDDDVAVFGEQDLGEPDSRRRTPAGDARVLRQLPVLAVHGNEEARLHQREHQLQLFFAAVPRDVDVLDALVNHVGAATGEVIDHPADRFSLPGIARAEITTVSSSPTLTCR